MDYYNFNKIMVFNIWVFNDFWVMVDNLFYELFLCLFVWVNYIFLGMLNYIDFIKMNFIDEEDFEIWNFYIEDVREYFVKGVIGNEVIVKFCLVNFEFMMKEYD